MPPHQKKGLMSGTMAVHVRYKSLYISLPTSAKQQREMASGEPRTTAANFRYFYLDFKAGVKCVA